MDPTIEIEVNTCFPLMYLDQSALKQDVYITPAPESPWGDINAFSNYISESVVLIGDMQEQFWQLPTAKNFQKTSCNSAFSALIKTRTSELESQYATGIPTLECSASEWTTMFEYEFHNACQYKWKGIKKWYCMGRFNENGMLQFAFMHELPANDAGCTSYGLGDLDCNFMNKDIAGTSMLLADAEASRHIMLDSRGRLKKALNPVLLGVISNEQPITCIENANETVRGITRSGQDKIEVDHAAIPGLFSSRWSVVGGPAYDWEALNLSANPAIQQVATTSMLGFIYTIWGAMYRNTLYMTAIKLPIPGTGSFVVKGTYDGQPTWYRLQTAPGDLYTDINPYLPGEDKATPGITAADLCVIDGMDKTETLKALEDFGFIEEGSEIVIDPDDGGLLTFYPVRYTNFNVEKFLDWYGSDEEIEDSITLATIDSKSPYSDGMKLNWQGDIFMNTCLTGQAGYFNCLVEDSNDEDKKQYSDIALSYYSPKSTRYKYCALSTELDPETEAMNMLLFTYSGLFPVGDPAGELTELADGAVTAVGYLCTGTKEPEYTIGGMFNKPSIPCLMGANQFCCDSGDCSEAYNDGDFTLQQCGGPFTAFRIGNHKLECSDYRFDCEGNFIYCGQMESTATKIRTKWGQPGLMHEGGACSADKAQQPYKTPYLQYMVGSRPILAGGSIMGGVNYICANIRKIGNAYSILFAQGQAYNGWNSFYANIGTDITNVVAAKYDPTVRGDLAGDAPSIYKGKTEAMLYNDFAYTLQAPPVYVWEDAIVGFYPAQGINEMAGDGDGVNVYIHKLDECDRPELYRIEVTASAMKWLASDVELLPAPGIHMHAYSYGFIKRLGKGSVTPNAGNYNATSMHMAGYWGTRIGTSTTIEHSMVLSGKDLSRQDRQWQATDIDIHHHIMSGIYTLEALPIPVENFEDQEFIVSARAKTFHGVCSCFSLREDSGLKPARSLDIRYKTRTGRKVTVTSSCWYYLALHRKGLRDEIAKQNAIVSKEMKLFPQGDNFQLSIDNPYLSWQVSLNAARKEEFETNSGVLYFLDNTGNTTGTVRKDENNRFIFYMHPNEISPVPAYITSFTNREDKYIHRTKFDLWLYDEVTRDEVIPYVKGLTGIEIPAYDPFRQTFDLEHTPNLS